MESHKVVLNRGGDVIYIYVKRVELGDCVVQRSSDPISLSPKRTLGGRGDDSPVGSCGPAKRGSSVWYACLNLSDVFGTEETAISSDITVLET